MLKVKQIIKKWLLKEELDNLLTKELGDINNRLNKLDNKIFNVNDKIDRFYNEIYDHSILIYQHNKDIIKLYEHNNMDYSKQIIYTLPLSTSSTTNLSSSSAWMVIK